MSFISSPLIAVARTSSTMLKKEVKADIPVFFLTFHSLLSMMLSVCFSCVVFIMFRYVPPSPTLLRVFIINGCWILSNVFSACIDMLMWFLYLHFLCGESDLLICECCTNLPSPGCKRPVSGKL